MLCQLNSYRLIIAVVIAGARLLRPGRGKQRPYWAEGAVQGRCAGMLTVKVVPTPKVELQWMRPPRARTRVRT